MQAAAKSSGPLESRSPLPKPYRVLVVDDHAVVRRGVRSLLASQPGIEVCGEASTGVEALEHVKKSKPDLVILDLTMPDMNGLETARAVKEASPETEVIVLTMHFSDELAREVLRTGAIAYVLKSDADAELLAAVDHARHHQLFFTSQLALSMAQNFVGDAGEAGAEGEAGSPLTPREIEVVQLLAEGKSNKEVATALEMSVKTVETHRANIMRKLNLHSLSELVLYAVRNHIVQP